MNSKPGTYVLILRSDKRASVQVGKWGKLDAAPGYYAYIGSAFGPGGVLVRVSRHCRSLKKQHWHVDYLREAAQLESVWYSHAPTRLEHTWARAVAGLKGAQAVTGFGCTDCNCESHLYFFSHKPALAAFKGLVGADVRSWSCENRG